MTRERKDGRKKPPVLIIVASTVFISFMLSFFLGHSGILRLRQLEQEYDNLIIENQRMAVENKKYADEIQRLRHDPAAVERIAREDLHYVSPHDRVLIVPEK